MRNESDSRPRPKALLDLCHAAVREHLEEAARLIEACAIEHREFIRQSNPRVDSEHMEPSEKLLYTTAEVASILRVHVNTVRAMIRQRRLRAARKGTRILVHRDDLERCARADMSDFRQAGRPRQPRTDFHVVEGGTQAAERKLRRNP